MNSNTNRNLAIVGLILQLGIPIGLLFAGAFMFAVFGSMSGDIAQAAATITGGVARALWSIVIGEGIALIGLGPLGAALFGGKFRAPWLFKWGRLAMIPWLLVFPLGTIVGVIGLVYFAKRRAEFYPQVSPREVSVPASP
jgi:hypothetical protein